MASGQSTLVLKPGPDTGIDATICNSPTWNTGTPLNSRNFGTLTYQRNEAWTANSNGSPEHDWRSLIRFDGLDTLQEYQIVAAHLLFHYAPDFPYSNGGRFGLNQTEVFRINETWEEMDVTWNNQPSFDPTASITIPTSNDFTSISVDVTDWVSDMVANPSSNFGFILIPSDDSPYRSMDFASSDHADDILWPELIVEYEELPPTEPTDTCVFEFPNVFTPDGNGINDVFNLVSNCEPEATASILVYDRWGNKVFSSVKSQNGWDGKYNGQNAISGVYIFQAKVEAGEKVYQFSGNLTLLR